MFGANSVEEGQHNAKSDIGLNLNFTYCMSPSKLCNLFDLGFLICKMKFILYLSMGHSED